MGQGAGCATDDAGNPALARRPALSRSAPVAVVLANALPFLGVLLLDWDLAGLLLLYWSESAIVGGLAFLHLPWVVGRAALFLVPFCVLHFGVFMLIHLLFLGALTDGQVALGPQAAGRYGWAWLGLLAAHAVPFLQDAPWSRARPLSELGRLIMEPYKRILVLHGAIILGAALVQITGSATWLLLLLIALKTAVDLWSLRFVRAGSAPLPG